MNLVAMLESFAWPRRMASFAVARSTPSISNKDAAGLDLGDPEFRRALARTHADFGRLLGHRHIREDADPDAAGALHLAGDGAAAGFDLARIQAFRLQGLQAIGAERQRRAGLGSAVDAALELLAEFCALG